MPPKTGVTVRKETIRFDAKHAKIFFGSKMFSVLSENFEDKFKKIYEGASLGQKIDIIKLFCDKFFPKEVVEKAEVPFDDWSDEELRNFTDHGIKPEGKVIYVKK